MCKSPDKSIVLKALKQFHVATTAPGIDPIVDLEDYWESVNDHWDMQITCDQTTYDYTVKLFPVFDGMINIDVSFDLAKLAKEMKLKKAR